MPGRRVPLLGLPDSASQTNHSNPNGQVRFARAFERSFPHRWASQRCHPTNRPEKQLWGVVSDAIRYCRRQQEVAAQPHNPEPAHRPPKMQGADPCVRPPGATARLARQCLSDDCLPLYRVPPNAIRGCRRQQEADREARRTEFKLSYTLRTTGSRVLFP
ncbi:hypothetical protein Pan110_06490 [Gimesia panareensis]|nr:hypothetical protein Pan110_06490 [Gimesia panareensis]